MGSHNVSREGCISTAISMEDFSESVDYNVICSIVTVCIFSLNRFLKSTKKITSALHFPLPKEQKRSHKCRDDE